MARLCCAFKRLRAVKFSSSFISFWVKIAPVSIPSSTTCQVIPVCSSFSQMLQILAITSFKEALENLENKNFKIQISGGGYHKKSALPNEGYLELAWDKEKISRFLRAMDCGALSGIAKPKIKLLGEDREILFYEICNLDLILNLSNNIFLKIKGEENAKH